MNTWNHLNLTCAWQPNVFMLGLVMQDPMDMEAALWSCAFKKANWAPSEAKEVGMYEF